MKSVSKGWVVVNHNHPSGGDPYIIPSTFAYFRKDAIKSFLDGSGSDWKYWYRNYNFRCVKAEIAISTLDK